VLTAAAESMVLREAGPSDLEPLVRFLRRREGTDPDEAAARRTLQDLDPARCVAWLAHADGRTVGLSTVLLRELAVGGRTLRAGYWCALYVDPEFRRRMVYPLLPRAMHRGLAAAGLDLVYASVRIPWLVEAHRRIGLRKLGDLPVLAKPLAPVALLARHRGLGAVVEAAGRPVDLAAAAFGRLRRAAALAGHEVEALPWGSPGLAELEPLWARAAAGRLGQPWTAELLRRRYDAPGTDYALLAVRRRGRPVAAAVCRAARRERLLVGVLLDVVAADPGDRPALRAALAAVEAYAQVRGCHAVIALDGPGLLPPATLQGAGWLRTPETYAFLVWPCRRPDPDPAVGSLAGWRHGFGDHDAF
jgi:hypothetical protein